ncbi:hypothetical protein POM88_044034 [Heracleum sosnowskyi]|uniref:Uncharacterized protein n=1 Tax=Heracleum sosnowskyi TaxID=360622 RepID=A0AAD8H4M2_9APIA|nr:hypothetical protein POM88_044034 [Heracleum sosnowskyi]
MAWRTFWLQALVCGHLVRRQAVATLQCIHAMVKFQALVRGRIIRLSNVGHEVYFKIGETLINQWSWFNQICYRKQLRNPIYSFSMAMDWHMGDKYRAAKGIRFVDNCYSAMCEAQGVVGTHYPN